MRKIYIGIVLVVVCFLSAFLYDTYRSHKAHDNIHGTSPNHFSVQEAQKDEVITVEVDTVVRGDIARRVTTIGTLIASKFINIVPDQEGRITTIFFNQGERVEEGQLLLEMDNKRHVIRVERSQAHLQQALRNYERGQKLFKQKAISESKLDEFLNALKVAEAEWKASELELDGTKLKAPFAGLVGLQNISVGSFIGRNQEILTLVNNDVVYVDFSIPQSYTSLVNVGMGVSIFVDGMGDLPFLGRVVAIDAKADPDTHSVFVRGQIDNPDNKLRPGQFSRVILEIGKEENILLIPWSAVKQRDGRTSVFKVNEEGRSIEVSVLLGQRSGYQVHVVEGLKEGEVVVSGGHMRLASGMSVKIDESKESEPITQ